MRIAAPQSTLRRWLDAVVAGDPGLQALRRAARVTLAASGAVFTATLAAQAWQPTASPTVALFAGMIGLQCTVAASDPAPRQRGVTLLLLAGMAGAVTVVATALAGAVLVVRLLLLALIFGAYYLRRFGPRYFALGLIGFMTAYFLALVHATFDQLPQLVGAIGVGIGWAALSALGVLPEYPARVAQRSLHSFYAAAARVLDLLCALVQDAPGGRAWRQALHARLVRLNARVVELEDQLADTAIDLRGRVVHPDRLRVVLFDLLLAVETIARAVEGLEAQGALAGDSAARQAVLPLLSALRDAFRRRNIQAALPTIERALEELAHAYAATVAASGVTAPAAPLLRRLGMGARWVVDDIARWPELAAQPLAPGPTGRPAVEADDRTTVAARGSPSPTNQASSPPDRPSCPAQPPFAPTTIQALQATAAGALSLVLGARISPDHPYWTLLAAFVVFSNATSIGKVYQRAFHRVLGTALGAVAGFGLASHVTSTPPLAIVLLFVCVFCAFYLFTRLYGAMVFFITIMLALMYGLLLGGVTPQLMEARVLDTLIGAAVGLAMSIVIFPTYPSAEVRTGLRDLLAALAAYLQRYLDDLAAGRAPGHDPELVARILEVRRRFEQVRAAVEVARRVSGPQGRRDLDRLLTALMTAYHYAGQLASPAVRAHALAHDRELADRVQGAKVQLLANVEALIQALDTGAAVACLQPLELLEPLRQRPPAAHAAPPVGPSGVPSEVFAGPGDPLRYLVRLDRALAELAAASAIRTEPCRL
jgi:hypothetical protein